MLICLTKKQGCMMPIKTFVTEQEMGEFLTKACEELAKRKTW
jgi:hypothetical protein